MGQSKYVEKESPVKQPGMSELTDAYKNISNKKSRDSKARNENIIKTEESQVILETKFEN